MIGRSPALSSALDARPGRCCRRCRPRRARAPRRRSRASSCARWGSRLLDVLPVRADQPGEGHVGVVDPQVVALADEPLGQLDERALAQVVGAGLERRGRTGRSGAGRSRSIRSTARRRCASLDGSTLSRIGTSTSARRRRVDQAAQVLGQAGAAEGEAGPQVGRADVELAVGQEDLHHLVRVDPERPADAPTSLAKPILRAWNALSAYLVISATGIGDPEHRRPAGPRRAPSTASPLRRVELRR